MTDSHGSVTGKRIILEIVREMRDGLHPLLYSRVAPGLYCVYLHPEDFSRLEGLVPRMRAEAQRALAEEMRRLNEPARPQGLRWFTAAEKPLPPIEVPAHGWEIQIEADRDDEVAAGTFVILSRLTLPALPQFEGGSATTKVFKTVVSGEKRTKTEQVFKDVPTLLPASTPVAAVVSAPAPAPALVATPTLGATAAAVAPAAAPPPAIGSPSPATERTGRVLAQIAVQDTRGPRLFVMDKADIKIGRGGQFRLVDLQLDGPTRISRVHARIRRDDHGRFFIKDLSEWGTTVNGQRIARGVVKEGEEIREIDVEAELPARARIGLAELIFLDFTAAEQTTAIVHTSESSSAGAGGAAASADADARAAAMHADSDADAANAAAASAEAAEAGTGVSR